ncbi:MAG: ATP-binding cassette domain-containing protein [Rhodobacteraceae bacterium]|nr:ATP-binding cassette domain-containing protein [Paracoccaceae bacterium]
MSGGGPILRLDGVTRDFVTMRTAFGRPLATLRAVAGVSLDVEAGETLGIVGESGCGKTTLGRMIVRLDRPTAGRIDFLGRDLATLTMRQMRALRRDIQIVFQDPYSSLNPRMKVRDIIAEPLEATGMPRPETRARVAEVMETVRLPAAYADRYPHAFSGGQRQRIGIARALAVRPKLIVCDEAVSALDVSVQAQILNLLAEIQRDTGVTLVFISHNLGVIRHLSHRVAVMYLGRVVELAPEAALFEAPQHPYTQALMAAIPEPDVASRGTRAVLTGDIPSPLDPPPGCPFHLRCPRARVRCRVDLPALVPAGSGRAVACHYPGVNDPGQEQD